MKFKYCVLNLAVILIVITTTKLNVEARSLKLRPLSAREVYRILKEAGREDAIPQGRIVTQGLAAITGFALGLTKGVGGALLFDLATSNATAQFINNFNVTGLMSEIQNLNMTTFTQYFTKGGSVSTNSSSNATVYITQEICFQSRSLESDEQARYAGNDENEEYGRQAIGTPTASTLTPSGTQDINAAGTAGTDTGADDNNDTGTDTVTDTTTDTDNGGSQTCIVIQKPKVRKRRSAHRKRY